MRNCWRWVGHHGANGFYMSWMMFMGGFVSLGGEEAEH